MINTVKHNEVTRKTCVFLFWWVAQVAQRKKKSTDFNDSGTEFKYKIHFKRFMVKKLNEREAQQRSDIVLDAG